MYIKRDVQGRIVALSAHADEGFVDEPQIDSRELTAFLRAGSANQSAGSAGHDQDKGSNNTQRLLSSDAELARVLEDIIDVLIAKGIFQFTELPAEAQKKLLSRRHLRQRIRKLDLIGDDDEEMML